MSCIFISWKIVVVVRLNNICRLTNSQTVRNYWDIEVIEERCIAMVANTTEERNSNMLLAFGKIHSFCV